MHLTPKSALVAGTRRWLRPPGRRPRRRRRTRRRSTSRSPTCRRSRRCFSWSASRAPASSGLDYELTFFNGEELAIQAILAGQADVGLGSPYAVIQRASVPVRLFQQTSRIIFFPVVKADIKSWQDMEGKSMTYHSRGGPLEALAEIVTEREGITLGPPNFVPGSENRVVALVQGHIDAAIIDLLNKNMILAEHPDEFRVLPWVAPEEVVTDEALFARLDWLQQNEDKVALLLEELLKSARDLRANPALIAEQRKKYDLLPDLPQELADGLADYYAQAIEAGVYSCDGGSAEAAETDLAVLSSPASWKARRTSSRSRTSGTSNRSKRRRRSSGRTAVSRGSPERPRPARPRRAARWSRPNC